MRLCVVLRQSRTWRAPVQLVGYITKCAFALHLRKVGVDHFPHQFVECDLVMPAEPLSCLARVAEQPFDLGWPEVTRINLDEHAPIFSIDALFVDTLAAPFDRPADAAESLFDEFPHRMLFAGRQNIVVGLRLLHNQPHPFDIIARMAPVAPGREVAEEQLVLQDRARSRRPRG